MRTLILLLLLFAVTGCSTTYDNCNEEVISRKYNKESNRDEDLILLHCKDTVYYILEDKLLYKFPIKKK